MQNLNISTYLALAALFLTVSLLIYIRGQVYRIKRTKKELLAFRFRKDNVLGELVSTRDGSKLIIDPKDDAVSTSIKVEGTWETHVSKVMKEVTQEGDTVVILGGHIGYHVIEFSKIVGPKGHVYVFEASLHNFFYLSDNVKINNAINVTCYQKAVYSKPEILNFSERSYIDGAYNSGGSYVVPGKSDRLDNVIRVEAVMLDEALSFLDKVDVIQMDIEGSEIAAIMGARKLIERSPNLKVIQEWSLGMMSGHGNVEEYVRFWEDLGYSFGKIRLDRVEKISGEKLLLEKELCDILISKAM